MVPPTEPCALRSTQSMKLSTRDFSWGKDGRCVWLRTYHPCSAETSRKSGALIYPDPFGPPWPVAGDLNIKRITFLREIGLFIHFLSSVCYINSMQMKNIRDRWIHGPMNAKENAITNLILFFSVRQLRYHIKCLLIADTPTEIQN